jgi:hypothetical protein
MIIIPINTIFSFPVFKRLLSAKSKQYFNFQKKVTMKRELYSTIFVCIVFCASNFSQNTWTQRPTFSGVARYEAVGFSIGNKGYIGTGLVGNTWKSDFWEYDPSNGVWTQKANYQGGNNGQVSGAVGFSIGSKGYIGTGWQNANANKYNDFWEYDPASNNWTQKANLGGAVRRYAFGFSIGTKGYIGGGDGNSVDPDDMWEYNQNTNIWTLVANGNGATGYYAAAAFSIGTKAYVGQGNASIFWEWDQSTQGWTQKASYPGNSTNNGAAFGFAIGSCGFMGTGGSGNQDFWMYLPATNSWMQEADFGGGPREYAVGFSIISTGKGYAGTGLNISTSFQDFWEYTPDSICVTGIDKNISTELNIFPNPSTGKFILDSKITKGEISVYNVSGEKVFYSNAQSSEDKSIDLSEQPNGIYFLNIKTKNGSTTRKLIIQK